MPLNYCIRNGHDNVVHLPQTLENIGETNDEIMFLSINLMNVTTLRFVAMCLSYVYLYVFTTNQNSESLLSSCKTFFHFESFCTQGYIDTGLGFIFLVCNFVFFKYSVPTFQLFIFISICVYYVYHCLQNNACCWTPCYTPSVVGLGRVERVWAGLPWTGFLNTSWSQNYTHSFINCIN